MKTSYTRAYVLVFLTFLLLTFSPQSLAQGILSGPSVRLIYFLPKDRPARPERITALQGLIKESQTFFAEQMESHGYGRKTFRIETDTRSTPVVHRVNGKFNEDYYYTGNSDFKIWEEIYGRFDDLEHIYFIAIDVSYELLIDGTACGLGGPTFIPSGEGKPIYVFDSAAVRHRDIIQGQELIGGSAIIPIAGACFESLDVTLHELGHTFGLEHDFRDGIHSSHVMSFGHFDKRLSECAAEWLSVSPFFNNTKLTSRNQPGTIQLLSKPTYTPAGIKLRFQLTDPDGLHQAQLVVPENIGDKGSWGPYRLFDCKRLNGKTRTVEFISSSLTVEPVDRIMVQIIDKGGSITWATFLADIASLLPPPKPPKVVSIPDRNLAAAIRETLGLDRNDRITDRQMLRLRVLSADDKQIKNLAGLEHATGLSALGLGRNQINNYTPLGKLPKLKTLYLWANNISDLNVLPLMPQLEFLDLNWNEIRDVTPLSRFVLPTVF